MIVNSKNKSLNYILLKKGGYKLFSHKLIKKSKLPFISTNCQKNINLHTSNPFISEETKFSINNKYFTPNPKITLKEGNKNSLFDDSKKIEDSSIDIDNNSYQCFQNKKTRNFGTSINFEDFFPNDKNSSKLNINENDLTLMSFNSNKNNNNLNIFNNVFKHYKKNGQERRLNDETITNSTKTFETHLKGIKNMKKQKGMKEVKKLNEKKKFEFMKKVLKDDKNFLIDDYLKNKIAKKTNRFFSFNNISNRNSFLNIKNDNIKKDGHPIMIKDIRIKSLLNDYENKKRKLLKLKPLILNNNYWNNKYYKDINKASGINNYELKINLKKNFKSHIKFKNNLNFFDLTNSK